MTPLEKAAIKKAVALIEAAGNRVELDIYRPNDGPLEEGFARQPNLLGEARMWLDAAIAEGS